MVFWFVWETHTLYNPLLLYITLSTWVRSHSLCNGLHMYSSLSCSKSMLFWCMFTAYAIISKLYSFRGAVLVPFKKVARKKIIPLFKMHPVWCSNMTLTIYVVSHDLWLRNILIYIVRRHTNHAYRRTQTQHLSRLYFRDMRNVYILQLIDWLMTDPIL